MVGWVVFCGGRVGMFVEILMEYDREVELMLNAHCDEEEVKDSVVVMLKEGKVDLLGL